MNKIFRTKSVDGGLSVRLDQIVTIQYSPVDEVGYGYGLIESKFQVEILTTQGPKDAILTAAELDALHQAWSAAL